MIMKTAIIALGIFIAVSLPSMAAPKFEEVSQVDIEYWKWTADRTVSYWDLQFSAAEIKPLQDVLSRAKQVGKKETAWFITSLGGVISTKEGKYKVKMGGEKIARQTYRISITPIQEKGDAETEHFLLSKPDGREFRLLIEKLIAPKIRRNPDRTVKH